MSSELSERCSWGRASREKIKPKQVKCRPEDSLFPKHLCLHVLRTLWEGWGVVVDSTSVKEARGGAECRAGLSGFSPAVSGVSPPELRWERKSFPLPS